MVWARAASLTLCIIALLFGVVLGETAKIARGIVQRECFFVASRLFHYLYLYEV
jgi:hypothetical protein